MKKFLLSIILLAIFLPLFQVDAANVCAGKNWKSCPTGKTFVCLNNKPTCVIVSSAPSAEESAPQLFVSGTIDFQIQQIVVFVNKLSKLIYEMKGSKKTSSSSSSSSSSGSSEVNLTQGEGDGGVEWDVDKSSADGYMIVWSKKSGATYPKRTGDYYRFYSAPSARTGKIGTSGGSGTFYTRLCILNEDMECSAYSNEIKVTVGDDEEEDEDE